MTTGFPSNLGALPLLNGTAPCEGAKCVPYTADFSQNGEYDFDFTAMQNGGQISTIQTVFVDNTLNANNLVLTVTGSGQRIQVPKNSAGFFTILAPRPTKIQAVTTGLVLVYFGFINFYIPPTVWSAP